jgi:hypothetical protein
VARKGVGRCLGISPEECMRGIADIHQHSDPGGARQHFERQLQLLSE